MAFQTETLPECETANDFPKDDVDYLQQILYETCNHSNSPDQLFHEDTHLDNSKLQPPILDDIDLYLECSDDCNYVLSMAENQSPHALIGKNVSLRVSFPSPPESSEKPPEHKCPYCSHRFKQKHLLKKHVVNDHNNLEIPAASQFNCIKFIDKSNDFKNLAASEKLESINVKSKDTFRCVSCAYTCDKSKLLKAHMAAVHNPSRKFYMCEICGHVCKQKRTSDIHQDSHTGKCSATCVVCGKSFASKSILNRHARTHALVRLYQCQIVGCDKAFKTHSALRDHERCVHQVKIAKKTTEPASPSPMVNHFQCSWPQCSKSFRDKYNLMNHVKIHTGEKSRRCPHCCYTCVQKSSMDWHLKKKHS